MLATSFTCPSCTAVLKLANPVAAGKKIRCPKCDTVFAAPGADEPTAIRETSRPVPSPRTPIIDDDDSAEDHRERLPRSAVRNRRPADEYARDDDDDEDDRDEDDEAPRRSRPSKKLKKRPKTNSTLMAGLLVGGLILLLGAGAFSAWVWPGFLRGAGVPAGTGNEDVLAFVPADSAVFMGADLDLIKSELGGLVPLNQWGAGNGGMPPGLMESLSKIDKVVVAMQVDNAADPEIAVIMRTKIPYKEEEMRLSFKGEDRQTAHGKVYYKIPVAAVNQPGVFGQAKSSRRFLVGMPNDRIVLFGNMAPARLESVLASDGTKPNISGETLALVQDVDKSTAWFAVHVTEKMRREMAQNPNGFAGLGPKIGTAKDAIARVKGVAGTFSFAGALKATLSLTCANGNDARQIADTFRKLWDTDGKKAVPQLVLGVRLFGGNDLASALNEACSSLQFSQNGAKATASLSVTKPTLEKAIKEVQRLAQQMGGMGGPPKMNNPSRMGRPPNMPAPGPRKIGP